MCRVGVQEIIRILSQLALRLDVVCDGLGVGARLSSEVAGENQRTRSRSDSETQAFDSVYMSARRQALNMEIHEIPA